MFFIRNGEQGGTGWATVAAVSASLGQAGVDADDGMVLLLANQQPGDKSPSVGSTREQSQDTASAAMPSLTRLVHWPGIIDFLEEGFPGDIDTRATSPERKNRQLGSDSKSLSTTSQSAGAPRLDGEPTTPMKAGNEESTSGPRGQNNDGPNPEVTPESTTTVESHRGCAYDGGDVREQTTRNSWSGLVLLERGLCQIEGVLREMESDGARLPGSRIADAMDSIRDILKVKAGVHWGDGGREKNRPSISADGPRDNETGVSTACCTVEGRMVSKACAAAKRGDISALEVSTKQRQGA